MSQYIGTLTKIQLVDIYMINVNVIYNYINIYIYLSNELLGFIM